MEVELTGTSEKYKQDWCEALATFWTQDGACGRLRVWSVARRPVWWGGLDLGGNPTINLGVNRGRQLSKETQEAHLECVLVVGRVLGGKVVMDGYSLAVHPCWRRYGALTQDGGIEIARSPKTAVSLDTCLEGSPSVSS